MTFFVVYETALGYGLFTVTEFEDIASLSATVQESILDLARFGKICKLTAFVPFRSAQDALANINAISEGALPELLKDFLEANLPKVKSKKKSEHRLGVGDHRLAGAISEELSFPCTTTDPVPELIRGIRLHFSKMYKGVDETKLAKMAKRFKDSHMCKAQQALGHSYSRAKVKFNVHRSDNMIIQAICLLDQLDKDLNTLTMRYRELYSLHFPELIKIVNDNSQFTRLALLIGRRTSLSKDITMEQLEDITMDTAKAQQVVEAAKTSMGMDVSDFDLLNMTSFGKRVVSLQQYRKTLHEYLTDKMHQVAPNLSALIGETVGARLVSHAGSLTSLAKYPASTVQILGAEKALFRALKTKGNTPKYGLIFHSTFIGRAAQKNKGRISRYLANKCSIASRIDCFSDKVDSQFGESLRSQVEERLNFYETGEAPRPNIDVMRAVISTMDAADDDEGEADAEAMSVTPPKSKGKGKGKSSKKRKAADLEDEDEDEPAGETPKAEKKKKKKAKLESATPSSDKKKKKKKKTKTSEL